MSDSIDPDELPVDPEDETLVAYLDGELERSERVTLESRLVDDKDLRMRLQRLQQGWDLLGEIEDPIPNHRLVESTLELVAADMVLPRRGGKWFGKHRWGMLVGLACALGVGATLAIGAVVKSRQYQRQLNDLAVVENLDGYLHGSDQALMRQLGADQDWLQLLAAAGEIGYGNESISSVMSEIVASPAGQREAMIADLPLEKRMELKSRWERFKLFDEEKQNRIRQTAETVAAHPDQRILLMTMNAYAIWRETIQPPELRDRIESDDPEIRTAAIAEAVRNSQREIAERTSYMLDRGTVNRIYYVLRRFVQLRVFNGDDATKAAFQRLEDDPNVRDPIDEALRLIVERGKELGPYRPEPLTESELKWIRIVLSPEAVQKLEKITGGFQPIETMTLRIWAEEAVRRRYREANSESTLERYQSLDPFDREILDLLPPDQILEKLTE